MSKSPGSHPHPAKLAAAEQIDRELAASALEKRRRNETPTARELSALRKIEKQREEELRWSHYRSIPQKHWRQMSGRQAKVLNEQAERYGIPFGDAVVDLTKVAKAIHDFLAENKHKLAAAAPDGTDPAMFGPESPALERYRSASAQIRELELAQRKRELIPREKVHDDLMAISAVLRRNAESFQRRFGQEGVDMFEQMLNDCGALFSQFRSDDHDVTRDDPTPSSGN